MSDAPAIATIRRFGRFHTRFIGALGDDLLGSGFGLTEARVLYELAQRDGWRAGELARELGLDPAYLSRLLKRFAALGWLERARAGGDGRAYELRLTEAGHAAFAPLDEAARRQAGASWRDSTPASGRRWSARSSGRRRCCRARPVRDLRC